nr:hypothetical protein [uncultured Desulfobulbus sp.]
MLRLFQKQAFIRYLQEAGAQGDQVEAFIGTRYPPPSSADVAPDRPSPPHCRFILSRFMSYSRQEALELRREPLPPALALLGRVIVMVI